MKKIPVFIKHFGIKNVDLIKMFEVEGHEISPQSIGQKLDPNFNKNKFSKYELILLVEIEKKFLHEYREKLVKYKHLKFKENESKTKTLKAKRHE